MGGSEILFILLAVLVLFGADKLPEFARTIGKGMREVKKATDELKDEISRESLAIKKDVQENLDNFKLSEIDELKKDVKDSVEGFKFTDLDNPAKENDKPANS